MVAVLSRNEVRDRAVKFAAEWRDETRERAEAQTFWNEFLAIFGVNRRQVASFEKAAKRASTGRRGSADVFWPEFFLAEHKSRTTPPKDLAKALDEQAADYLAGNSIPGHQFPRLLVVSDFARMRIRDLDDRDVATNEVEFGIDELPRHIDRFMYLAGYRKRAFEEQSAVNIEAAELLGRVYDELEKSGYGGHQLRVFIVRLLFLLFADDTGLWERDQFRNYLLDNTAEDGHDLGMHLRGIFDVLNQKEGVRSRALDESLNRFPYVNGGLFREPIATADCTKTIRARIIEAGHFDWSLISPAIFGSMFQSVMDPLARRTLGAHYTSEQNILKVVEPLFLDDLRAALDDCGTSAVKLRRLHEHLGSLKFLDPACGCGNFLVITYRELRRLETELLTRLHGAGPLQQTLDIDSYRKVKVDQFYGIEIEEFPARIAETAMYLMDHLENERLGTLFGVNVVDLPLDAKATIVVDNALQRGWATVLAPAECDYVIGNPPFAGQKTRQANQTADLKAIFGRQYARYLDYVSGWFHKAADYMIGTDCRAAFVATNSITQGEQVALIWSRMIDMGYAIDFAHRSFRWSSEARGKAVVHCVVVGFSARGSKRKKLIFEYDTPNGTPSMRVVTQINPYLQDAATIIVRSTTEPLSPYLPPVQYGNKPSDGGFLIVEPADFPSNDPVAQSVLRRCVGTQELLHDETRYCIWIPDVSGAPRALRSPFVRTRVEGVKRFRLNSTADDTKKMAMQPYRFFRIPQPNADYIAIPRHVSASRPYFTASPQPVDVIATDAIYTVVDPDCFVFGLLSSSMFIGWLRAVGGQLKNDLRFAQIAYNSFPLPEVQQIQRTRICQAAKGVLSARAKLAGISLADQYDPLGMSAELLVAHRRLDMAVDKVFKQRGGFRGQAERVALLFDRYQELAGVGTLAAKRRPS